ncbi:hypothetical protein ANN_08481 [Periplaneta americana]|uniref:Uncharacterized protein n=1 Tax=Periplaneta americana TaxID=6978 RepID=A0ABQ8T367_PERAM|nr:hypothetical protein ANN_08481 [Periplaneta americana]
MNDVIGGIRNTVMPSDCSPIPETEYKSSRLYTISHVVPGIEIRTFQEKIHKRLGKTRKFYLKTLTATGSVVFVRTLTKLCYPDLNYLYILHCFRNGASCSEEETGNCDFFNVVFADKELLKKKVKYLEEEKRRNKLLFFGIEEQEKEQSWNTYEVIVNVYWEWLVTDIGNEKIKEVCRMGIGKNMPILVRLANRMIKEKIMGSNKTLKDSSLSIEEGFEYVILFYFIGLFYDAVSTFERNEGDNAGEMNPGSSTESYPAFARIGLRENPGKNLNQVTCSDRDSNPGHLVSRPEALTVTPQFIFPRHKKFRDCSSGPQQQTCHCDTLDVVFVTEVRDLRAERVECMRTLQLIDAIEEIKDPRTGFYDTRRMRKRLRKIEMDAWAKASAERIRCRSLPTIYSDKFVDSVS